MCAQPQCIETCGGRDLFHELSLPVIGRPCVSPDIRRSGGNSGVLRCSFREMFVCVQTRRHVSVASRLDRDNCGWGEFESRPSREETEKTSSLTTEDTEKAQRGHREHGGGAGILRLKLRYIFAHSCVDTEDAPKQLGQRLGSRSWFGALTPGAARSTIAQPSEAAHAHSLVAQTN
jgi:hypothetical protein